MTDGVADVMGESTDGEGEFVRVMGVSDETADEISGANIVCQIAQERVAEGIIAEVLNGATPVSVGVGLVNLRFGEARIAFEQERTNGLLPGKIDNLLMALERVGMTGFTKEQEKECERKCL